MGNTHDSEVARIEADYIKTRWRTTDDYRWGYTKDRGPETWWMYYPSAAGGSQSPIDIVTEDTYVDPEQMHNGCCLYHLDICYLSSSSHSSDQPKEPQDEARTVVNTGNAVRIALNNSCSYITGGPCRDCKYLLHHVDLHWGENDLWGSEHLINGNPFAAEVHLVHWNSDLYEDYEEAMKRDGAILIIAVFAKLSNKKSNKSIDKLSLLTEDITYRGQRVPVTDVDIDCLIPDSLDKYWTYLGSFTTPPCYETVTWIVIEQPTYITTQQLDRFRQLRCYTENEERPTDENDGRIVKNVRPVQPIGTRKVTTAAADDIISVRPIIDDQYESSYLDDRQATEQAKLKTQRRDQLYQWQQ